LIIDFSRLPAHFSVHSPPVKANAAFALLLAGVLTSPAAPNDEAWVQFSHSSGSFPLVSNRNAAALVFDASDATVVGIAVRDLALDVQRVTGIKPVVRTNSTCLLYTSPSPRD